MAKAFIEIDVGRNLIRNGNVNGFEHFKKALVLTKSIIDRFARDYIRYDIRWGMRVKISDSMKKYAKAFHFKKTPAALAYYALSTQKEREKLLEVLEKFG